MPLTGYVVKSGDRICWRQSESEPGGGLGINFTNNTSNGWVARDQDGNLTNSDNAPWGWHNRCVDLTPNAGLTVSGVWIGSNAATAGTWDILFGDIAITSTDGTVTPLYWRDSSVALSSPWTNKPGPTNLQAYVETTNASLDMLQPDATTTYYQGDQIGSARVLTSAGGWPVESYTFYPFGQDAAPSADPNHYKFTGKERDQESGLDYFGARYYASSMGRWMSPDWADKPEAVPYSTLDNPQSLNLYAYVGNNPLGAVDPDGHYWCNNAPGSLACQNENAWDSQHGILTDASKNAIARSPLKASDQKTFTSAVEKASGTYNINPNLLVGLAAKESGINPSAVNDGARGIYQIRKGRQADLGISDEVVTSVGPVVAPVAKYLSHSFSVLNEDMDLTIGSWRQGLHGIQVINKEGPNAVWDYVIEPAKTTGKHQHPARTLGDDYIDYVDSFF